MAQETESVDGAEETGGQQKVTCDVERLFHVVESDLDFDSCDHGSLWVDP